MRRSRLAGAWMGIRLAVAGVGIGMLAVWVGDGLAQVVAPRPTAPAVAPAGRGELAPAVAVGAAVPDPGLGKIELTADRLDVDRANKLVEAMGNVVIRKGDEELRAEYVRFQTDTEVADAVGDVVVTRGQDVWRGPALKYDFKTGAGLARRFAGDAGPFYIQAEESEKLADGRYAMRDVALTTCAKDDHWHYYVTARRLELKPDDYLKARGTVWHFGRVPVLYLPYWHRNLEDDFGWSFRPGQSSRMGTFLLSAYRYRLSPVLRGRTHVDMRTRRGVAFGQDFMWNLPDREARGSLQGYYLDDDEPLDEDDDPVATDLDNHRYRLRVEHLVTPSPRDTLRVQAGYLSDTDIIEDFFEREYRRERQPDNFAAYTHRGDGYAASLLMRSRLNDFFDSVNRLPEASVDVFRRPVGVADLFYESRTAGAVLEREYADHLDADAYDAMRLDTRHRILRPDKHFGFLVAIPRVGYRGTYYSATRAEQTAEELVTTSQTQEIVSGSGVTNQVVTTTVTTNSVTRVTEEDADLRSNVEFGLETSFKAFKTWEGADRRYRHVAEPFADWTYIPEPNLTPDALYQFDEVDQVDESHFVKLGVRNKLQTKWETDPERQLAYELQTQRRLGPADTTDEDLDEDGFVDRQPAQRAMVSHNLADLEIYTIYRIQRDPGQDALEDIFWDGEFRPVNWVAVDLDGNWDLNAGEVERFNTELILTPDSSYRATLGYRYRVDASSLLYMDLTLFPLDPWSYNVYGRYEFEDSRFQEQGGYVQRMFDCMAVRLGMNFRPGYDRSDGTARDDEYRFMLEFWLTAFPQFSVGGKQKS